MTPGFRTPATASFRQAAALVALGVAVAYANALGAAFQFDDWNVIVDNARVHAWAAWWAGMPGIRPLLKATYTANWTSGYGAPGFHAVNVVLHGANALMALAIGRQVLGRAGLDPRRADPAAFVAALVFALHPAQTEAVTYVSGRSVSLMACFYLAGVLCHLRARATPWPVRWRLAACACIVLALASKEIAWTFPFAIVLVELATTGQGWRDAWRESRGYWLLIVAVGIGALFIPRYWWLLGRSLEVRSLGENLLTQIDGIFYLLTHPLAALHLNADPDLAPRTKWSADLAAKALMLGALVVLGVSQWRRRRWLGLGIAWLFVQLLATNSVLPRLDVANDRQLYLAMLGLAWLLGVALSGLPDLPRWGAVGLLAVTLGMATHARNVDYATETAFWEATARVSPHKARVWNNLGYVRQMAGDQAGARTAYERALAIDPDDIKARINLGTLEDGPAGLPRHRD